MNRLKCQGKERAIFFSSHSIKIVFFYDTLKEGFLSYIPGTQTTGDNDRPRPLNVEALWGLRAIIFGSTD